MSNLLEEEIKKVRFANLIKDEEGNFFVKKENRIRLIINNTYSIRFKDDTNWELIKLLNNGRCPTTKYYSIMLISIDGQNIKFSGAGFYDEKHNIYIENFEGIVPLCFIEFLKGGN